MKKAFLFALLSGALAGCLSQYHWTSKVPEKMRTVSVSTFRNESDLTEFGAVASRQVLREFQREGTFGIRRVGDSAVEIQGIVKNVDTSAESYDRRGGLRRAGYRMRVTALVSVIDKINGKVIVDNVKYSAGVAFASGSTDLLTAKRDASGRLAEELARQIVDDVLAIKW